MIEDKHTNPESTPTRPSEAIPPTERLLSLDALRGFNMFWIIGGEDLASSFLERWHNPVLKAISDNLTSHVEWTGFHFYDMIFPLFLFIAGVALPFATAKRLSRGETRRTLIRHALGRTAILFACGLVYNGLLRFRGIDHLRIMGVLQRQALGYGFAAILILFAKPRRQLAVCIVILLAYWAILKCVPVPGYPRGDLSQHGNVANYVDRLLFKRHQMYTEYGDPEGPVSTLPAFATATIGLLAGEWLRTSASKQRKAALLAAAGVGCIALGNLWGIWLPVIKKIWTSSYVLVAGGWSLLLLALFYWLIEIRGWKRWAAFFVVIGVNPLTIYLLQSFVNFEDIARFFVEGALNYIPAWKPVLGALAIIMVKWLVLKFLDKHRVYMRA